MDNLTVEEMLLYTAEMKLEMDVSMEEKCRRVEGLLHQLALTACRHVRIGSSMQRGISGTSLLLLNCMTVEVLHAHVQCCSCELRQWILWYSGITPESW